MKKFSLAADLKSIQCFSGAWSFGDYGSLFTYLRYNHFFRFLPSWTMVTLKFPHSRRIRTKTSCIQLHLHQFCQNSTSATWILNIKFSWRFIVAIVITNEGVQRNDWLTWLNFPFMIVFLAYMRNWEIFSQQKRNGLIHLMIAFCFNYAL